MADTDQALRPRGAMGAAIRARSIMVVAGEASGDVHGATLARALGTLAPDVALVGMGGTRMAEVGVELLVDVTRAAVVGGTEAMSRVPVLYRAFRRLRRELAARRPLALVVIDFPEFNLRLARVAKRAGIPVVYFIPPQVWAWRPRRVATIRDVVSLVLAVFPFETSLYRRAGVPVDFVGHPILDALADAPSRAGARGTLGLADDALVVGLLPGSRREEVDRVLPPMLEAARLVEARHPHVRFVLGLAPTIAEGVLTPHLARGPRIDVAPGGAHAVMRASDVVLVASGTATLEAALLDTPMVVCYRVSRLSEVMGRVLVRVPWISLANIVLGRLVVPELYQANATGERLGHAALALLDDPAARAAQREAFAELRRELGDGGVGTRAARRVLELARAS